MTRRARAVLVLAIAGAIPVASHQAADPPIELFFDAAAPDDRKARAAMDQIAARWKNSYTPLVVDLARFLRPAPRPGPSEGPAPLVEDENATDTFGGEPRGIDTHSCRARP